MPETDEGTDFIVSELLSELKNENERKAAQIKGLYKMLVGAITAIVLVVAGFLWYLNQYDFVNYEEHSAEGFYAVVDSAGNVVGKDITQEQLDRILGGLDNG